MVGTGAWGSEGFWGTKGRPGAFRGRPLKVLLFNESLTGGGCERNLVELATHFDRSEVEPVVGIYHPDLHYAPTLDAAGVRYFVEPKLGKLDAGFYARLVARLRAERPDVVHSFMPTPGFWIKVTRLLAGRPPLVIFHGTIQPAPRELFLDAFLKRTVAAVIANSSIARREAIEEMGYPEGRVHLLYNGVDLEHFSPGEGDPALREELGVPAEALLLVVVARVRQEKNHACLVRALVRMHARGALPPHVHGRFIGRRADEVLIQGLERELSAAGLGGRFTFSGPRMDVARVLRGSDALILPSFFEGCPNAVQEAMACGLPVVVSDVSDNQKLVHEGESGYLFPVDNDVILAEKLGRLFALTPAQRRALGEAGRRIISAYSMKEWVAQTVQIYRGALER